MCHTVITKYNPLLGYEKKRKRGPLPGIQTALVPEGGRAPGNQAVGSSFSIELLPEAQYSYFFSSLMQLAMASLLRSRICLRLSF